jgi:hypothetical protein
MKRTFPYRLTLAGHTGWVVSAQFSPDGRRIVTASSDETAKLWDAVLWESDAWADDTSRSRLLALALRDGRHIKEVVCDPLLREIETVLKTLVETASETTDGAGASAVRGVPGQGVLLTKAPEIPSLPLHDHDLIIRVNSRPVSSVDELREALKEFVDTRRNTPEKRTELRLDVVNNFDRRLLVLKAPDVPKEEVTFQRNRFVQYCRFTAAGTRAVKRRVEEEGRDSSSLTMTLELAAAPLNLRGDDAAVEWDGHKIEGSDSLIERLEALAKAASEGTLSRSQLLAVRRSTGEYIFVTIRVE